MRKLILSKSLRVISQYLVKLSLDSRTDAFNHHCVLTPDNWTYNWTSASTVVEVMEIKTKILSRLTDNFTGFCITCHTPLFSRHPCFPKSPPTAWKTCPVSLFPIGSKYYPPCPPVFSCPNRILGDSHWDLPAVSTHIHINIYSAVPVAPPAWTDLAMNCHLAVGPCWCRLCYSLLSCVSLYPHASQCWPILCFSSPPYRAVPTSSVFLMAAVLNSRWWCSHYEQEL